MLVSIASADGIEQIEVAREDILQFRRGLLGFEELTEFVLFELDSELHILQSVADPNVGFVVIDPLEIDRSYSPSIPGEVRALLGIDEHPKSVYQLCVVILSPEGVPMTANLRAPIVVNARNRSAVQLVLQDSNYSVRHPFLAADARLGSGWPGSDGIDEGRVPPC